MRYAIVIEQAGTGYSAYVPDLPGCIATGATVGEVRQAIDEAIRFHIEGLRADGSPVPASRTLPETSRSRSETVSGDPFAAFTEWAGAADEAAYADL